MTDQHANGGDEPGEEKETNGGEEYAPAADGEKEYIPTAAGATVGEEGEQVERLQSYLKQFGYLRESAEEAGGYAPLAAMSQAPEAEEGVFDQATMKGLRRFQQFAGLPVTGELDRATLAKMHQPRCGFVDLPQGGVSRPAAGGTETSGVSTFVAQGNRWERTDLTYDFEEFTPDVPEDRIRDGFERALAYWSKASALTFAEERDAQPDVRVRFVDDDHGDGNPFDGAGGVLAHAYFPPPNGGDLAGDVHFDEDENWTTTLPVPSGGVDFETVAAHEIGHALGLAHSPEPGALMNPFYGGPHRHLGADDSLGIQTMYGSRIRPVPDWFGAESQGADVAVADVSDSGRPDLVVFHVDDPSGENHGYYRLGWNLDHHGDVTNSWSDVKSVPDWFGAENQGAGVALADLDASGRPDLVVFHVDDPDGDNFGYYRIGRNLDRSGNVGDGWSEIKPVPGWFGWENQGASVALADVSGSGKMDLVAFHLDNPEGENHGYYRIGWDLDGDGDPTGGWSDVKTVPDWFGWENQGAGIGVADLDASGRPDLVVFHVDDPSGENHGYYRIGRNLDANGNVVGGWGQIVPVPGWFGAENQGAGIALADVNGNGKQDVIVFHVDNPSGENHGYYRVVTDL